MLQCFLIVAFSPRNILVTRNQRHEKEGNGQLPKTGPHRYALKEGVEYILSTLMSPGHPTGIARPGIMPKEMDASEVTELETRSRMGDPLPDDTREISGNIISMRQNQQP